MYDLLQYMYEYKEKSIYLIIYILKVYQNEVQARQLLNKIYFGIEILQ